MKWTVFQKVPKNLQETKVKSYNTTTNKKKIKSNCQEYFNNESIDKNFEI